MKRLILLALVPAWYLSAGACIQLPDTTNLLPVGTPFVVRGTMTVSNRGGCLLWQGENGVRYYLYQDPLLENGLFDQATRPGATARLVVSTRSDLPAGCEVDQVVEVKEVLEVLP